MERLTLIQQIYAALYCMSLCLVITFLIARFKYIWTVEFGNKWFWKKGAKNV